MHGGVTFSLMSAMGASPCPAPPAAAPALPLIRKGNKGCGLSVFWNKSQLGYESTPHNSQSIAMRLMSKQCFFFEKSAQVVPHHPEAKQRIDAGKSRAAAAGGAPKASGLRRATTGQQMGDMTRRRAMSTGAAEGQRKQEAHVGGREGWGGMLFFVGGTGMWL